MTNDEDKEYIEHKNELFKIQCRMLFDKYEYDLFTEDNIEPYKVGLISILAFIAGCFIARLIGLLV